MVTAAELMRALYGALLLARFDRDGLLYFDDTVEAFWQSFSAAVVVAPGAAIYILLDHLEAQTPAHPLRIFVVETTGYVALWVAFPLAMFYLAEVIDRSDRYIRYIVAFNWAVVVQIAAILLNLLAMLIGLISESIASIVGVVVVAAILIYRWFIARVALNIPGGGAALIVIVDLMILTIVWRVEYGLLHPTP